MDSHGYSCDMLLSLSVYYYFEPVLEIFGAQSCSIYFMNNMKVRPVNLLSL